jgi:hypothetical protein
MKPSHLAIANLAGNPHLNREQIAQLTGTSVRTVARVRKQVEKATKQAVELDQYQTLIRKRLPAEKRVKTLETILEDPKENPFARLKVVEYADAVLGIGPKQQTPPDQQAPAQSPMFVLPPGCDVTVNVLQSPDRRRIGDGDKSE